MANWAGGGCGVRPPGDVLEGAEVAAQYEVFIRSDDWCRTPEAGSQWNHSVSVPLILVFDHPNCGVGTL